MNKLQQKIKEMEFSGKILTWSIAYFSIVAERTRIAVERVNKILEEISKDNVSTG